MKDYAAERKAKLIEAVKENQTSYQYIVKALQPILEDLRLRNIVLQKELDQLNISAYAHEYYFSADRKWEITGLSPKWIIIQEDWNEDTTVDLSVVDVNLDSYFAETRERLIREALTESERKLKEYKEETKPDPKTKLENRIQQLKEILGDKKEAKK